MSQFDSTSYHYRWLINQSLTAESENHSTSETADLVVPILFFLKVSKRFRNDSDNRFNNAKNEPQNRNIFWFYELLLRSFEPKEDIFDQAQTHPFLNQPFTTYIEVYNLDQPLNQSINTQKLISTILSLSILSLLTFSTFLVFYAIHRIQKQRKLEQEFTATISHELRTPLTVIQSAADNLSEGFVNKPEAIIRYGNEIKKQSQRLNRMIESTLLYCAMPNQNKAKQDHIQTDDFLNEILLPLTQLANNNKIELNSQFNTLPKQIITDQNALRMILENLIMNSIIHGKTQNAASQIDVTLSILESKELKIQVQDNGMGIPKKEQKNIFKAFVRGKRSEQQQHCGSGLGLNLIKRMVNILSGDIQLQSPVINLNGEKETGVLFTILIPIQLPQPSTKKDPL